MLIRLCYSSVYTPKDFTLIEDIRDILTTSRKFNKQNNINGVLYYAERLFFQCLEGDEKIVKSLYTNICQDMRHHEVTLLQIEPINHIQFKNWTMKYVESSNPVKEFFKEQKTNVSQASILADSQLSHLLDILYTETEQNIMLDSSTKARDYTHYF